MEASCCGQNFYVTANKAKSIEEAQRSSTGWISDRDIHNTVAVKLKWDFKPGSELMEGLLRRVTVSALHSAYKDVQNSGLQDGEGVTTD